MPDYDPNRGTGQGPVRRPVSRPARRYGPGGLPTEGVDPAPKPWPIAPWLGLIAILGFLSLQLWPATHYRHPKDPHRTWYPIEYEPNDPRNFEAARRHFAPLMNRRIPDLDLEEKFEEDTMVGSAGEIEASDRANSQNFLRKIKTQGVQIFLCTDEKDLRPLVVVINSTISNARHPERLKFHLVIPSSESQLEYYKLTSFFPSASIEVVSEGLDFGEIAKLIKYRKDSKVGKELSTSYSFLPYYVSRLYKELDKILYLDTDVVVKGDIEELFMTGLEGHPIAAVKDCSQRYKNFFDFSQLNALQEEKDSNPWFPKAFDEEECVFNRGTLLIDVKQWLQQNVTEAIEWWMEKNNNAKEVLYKYELSQPPLLLALYKNYKELEHSWNVRGLGRDSFSAQEQDFFAEAYGQRPTKKPFLSMESDYAKILHFNGKFQPWKRDRVRLPEEEVVSLCGQEGQECYKLWWPYLSPTANDAFKHSVKQP